MIHYCSSDIKPIPTTESIYPNYVGYTAKSSIKLYPVQYKMEIETSWSHCGILMNSYTVFAMIEVNEV